MMTEACFDLTPIIVMPEELIALNAYSTGRNEQGDPESKEKKEGMLPTW